LAPVSAQGKTIGVLVLGRSADPYTEAEADFAATAAEYLFELARATDAVTVEQQATAGERKRIAQELHDGLAQELTGVVLSLEGAQRAFERNPQVLGQQLAKATRDPRATLADVRPYMGAHRGSPRPLRARRHARARRSRRGPDGPDERARQGHDRRSDDPLRSLARDGGRPARRAARGRGAARAARHPRTASGPMTEPQK